MPVSGPPWLPHALFSRPASSLLSYYVHGYAESQHTSVWAQLTYGPKKPHNRTFSSYLAIKTEPHALPYILNFTASRRRKVLSVYVRLAP